MQANNPTGKGLRNFAKGYDPRRNLKGRAKKYESTLGESGYKKSQVADAINILISLDEVALKEVSESEDCTVLEKIVSLALLESIRKKTLYNIETLLTRIYGQPKQEVDNNVTISTFNVKFNQEKLPTEDDGHNV